MSNQCYKAHSNSECYHVSHGAGCSDKPMVGVKIGFGTTPNKPIKQRRVSRFHNRNVDGTNLHYQSNYGGMNK